MAVINVYSIQSRSSQEPASFMTFEFYFLCVPVDDNSNDGSFKKSVAEKSHLFVDQFTFYRLAFEI